MKHTNPSTGTGTTAWRSLAQTASVVVCVIALFCGILYWTSAQVDERARVREKALVALVLKQAQQRVGQEQESATIWDEAVRKLAESPVDQDWIDLNIGLWFNEYAGHDEVYIYSPDDAPLYAMRNGRRDPPASAIEVRRTLAPLLGLFRSSTGRAEPDDGSMPKLSPGVVDLVMLHGHPAVVSIKPVITDSGLIPQVRGKEAAHVSIVYLDTRLMEQLRLQYGIANASFSKTPTIADGTVFLPLRTKDGTLLGYITWRAFAPGREVFAAMLPIVSIALVTGGIVIVLLTQRLRRRTEDLEQSRAQAHHLACHDSLTGLPNRSMFEDRLDDALRSALRANTRVALLTLDLDHFKLVNDTHGHPVGDSLLKEVTRRITAELGANDIVARIAGDEFAMILEYDDDADGKIATVCERLVRELAKPVALGGLELHVGASIGVARAPEDAILRSELARKSDVALYKAKRDGRNRVAFYAKEMDDTIAVRDATERDLRAALSDEAEQLSLLYQPVYCSKTGRATAVEALLRWDRPGHGPVAPSTFIPIAEETGLITELGGWIIETALEDVKRWPRLRLSINVSVIQLRAPDFVSNLMAKLERHGIEPGRLQIEVTETALMEPKSSVAAKLAELRAAGILIALDDFGTGYSSLSYIRDLAVDRIKIDRSFVTTIDTSDGSLVEALVTLAHASGLEVTAEGIETVKQYEFLTCAGCEELQGFLLSRPVAAPNIAQILSQQSSYFARSGIAA